MHQGLVIEELTERQCLLGLLSKCNFYNEPFFKSLIVLDPGNNVEVFVRESSTVAIQQKRELIPNKWILKSQTSKESTQLLL